MSNLRKGLKECFVGEWQEKWFEAGMLCVQREELDKHGRHKAFELPANAERLPDDVLAIGCGGWNEQGELLWVGWDLDVKHGNAKQAYASFEDALFVAMKIRERVGGAAEIRRSKSGAGLHVRVRIKKGLVQSDGRKIARSIAWWGEQEWSVKCDHAVLGRQNFWCTTEHQNAQSFGLVEEAVGEWTPPNEAIEFNPNNRQTAPGSTPIANSNGNGTAHSADDAEFEQDIYKGLSKTERESQYERYLLSDAFPESISGKDGSAPFLKACAVRFGFGVARIDAYAVLNKYNEAKCRPQWSEKEIEHKLDEGKYFGTAGDLLRPSLAQIQQGITTMKAKMQGSALSAAPTIIVKPPAVVWDGTDDAQAYAAIQGTPVQVIVDIMAKMMRPSIPLPITLPNALVLCGAELVQDNQAEFAPVVMYKQPQGIAFVKQGAARLKLKINTSGGQACNVYALVIAPSGVGKDVGNVFYNIAHKRGLLLGSDASGEGIYDELMDTPNGILSISEFENYLGDKSWQSNAAISLTNLFNKGAFRVSLSKRSTKIKRESDFAYPSLLGNIQPERFASSATRKAIEGGFLGRMLFTIMEHKPEMALRPCTVDVDLQPIHDVLDRYKSLKGVVQVPVDYLQPLIQEAWKVHSSSSRIVNEYAPRLAVMLAGDTVLKPEHWERAEVLCKYFLRNQSIAFGLVGENSSANRHEQNESLQNRFIATIKKVMGRDEYPTLNNILKHDRFIRRRTEGERKEALNTLLAAGMIDRRKDSKKEWYEPRV